MFTSALGQDFHGQGLSRLLQHLPDSAERHGLEPLLIAQIPC